MGEQIYYGGLTTEKLPLWRGIRLDKLSKLELIDVCIAQGKMIDDARKDWSELERLMQPETVHR